MSIKTLESLREHLQWAIELEHATIPPYMCALYSIQENHNKEPAEILKSIVMEEMLHICLVANLMNAIGGKPKLAYPGIIADYPAYLPHSDNAFQVPLEKFSPKMITEAFMNIEKPAPADAKAEDENYETLGQFYNAIQAGLEQLVTELGEETVFCGNPALQVGADTTYYGGSGRMIAVTDLASAREALHEIVEQGEGIEHQSIWDGDTNMFHPERGEVGHYFRLQEIMEGRRFQEGDTAQSGPTGEAFEVNWDAVWNIRPNPSRSDYPKNSLAYRKMTEFAQGYSDMLRLLEQTYSGAPELLAKAVGVMYELREVTSELMQMPSGDDATTVGPWFAYLPAIDQQTSAIGDVKKIVVRKNGPYVVHGEIPLTRKRRVASEEDESLAWQKVAEVETSGETYALCRCGQSSTKPFCDGTHDRIDFDGTETAAENSYEERAIDFPGQGINVKDDTTLCMHARFCFNRFANIKEMSKEADDVRVRTQIAGMIERCPSGTYSYSLDIDGQQVTIEPDLPQEIAALDELDAAGPLWVTGGISVERADGKPLETRNRMTLCRCGQSKNKPFCDGTHHVIKFKE